MFEKYMICKHDFHNVVEAGQVTGFQFKATRPLVAKAERPVGAGSRARPDHTTTV